MILLALVPVVHTNHQMRALGRICSRTWEERADDTGLPEAFDGLGFFVQVQHFAYIDFLDELSVGRDDSYME